MGIETIVLLGLTGLSTMNSINSSEKEAKATIAEGNIAASNKSKETRAKAARLSSSFLNSGLTLEGTPMSTIENTYNTGLEDINQISSNYNNKAKSIISKGRSSALSSFASGIMGMGLFESGGISSMFSSAKESAAYALNDMGFGETAYSMLDDSMDDIASTATSGKMGWTF